jgi:hypothetical protein
VGGGGCTSWVEWVELWAGHARCVRRGSVSLHIHVTCRRTCVTEQERRASEGDVTGLECVPIVPYQPTASQRCRVLKNSLFYTETLVIQSATECLKSCPLSRDAFSSSSEVAPSQSAVSSPYRMFRKLVCPNSLYLLQDVQEITLLSQNAFPISEMLPLKLLYHQPTGCSESYSSIPICLTNF